MLVTKKFNNNVVLCRDGQGRELVAFGKGIGFPQTPYELTDMSRVDRTFYNISSQYLDMLDTLPTDVVEFTAVIVDQARDTFPYELSPNLLLTMSDHIAFAMERQRKGIRVKMPLAYDLEQNYPREMEFSQSVLEKIWQTFKIRLPRDEVSGIAMGFINARVYSDKDEDLKIQRQDEEIMEEITNIVEQQFHKKLDRTSFNYARYASHIQYLLQRLRTGEEINTVNADIYQELRGEYPDTAACVDRIDNFLKKRYGYETSEEEHLYLLLHINRVASNEEVKSGS